MAKAGQLTGRILSHGAVFAAAITEATLTRPWFYSVAEVAGGDAIQGWV